MSGLVTEEDEALDAGEIVDVTASSVPGAHVVGRPELPIRAVSAAIEQASRSDRGWFKRHRERAHRLRPAVSGAFPGTTWPAGAVQLALVKQVRPGTRIRLALWGTRSVCDCEDCLADAWDRFAPAKFRALAVAVAAVSLKAAR